MMRTSEGCLWLAEGALRPACDSDALCLASRDGFCEEARARVAAQHERDIRASIDAAGLTPRTTVRRVA